MKGNARWAVVRNRPYLVHLTALQLLASDAKEIYENIVQVIKINRKLISSQIDSGRNGVIILEICSKDFEPVFGMCNFSFSLEQWQLLL